MSSFGVILDACTLVPLSLRDILLRAAAEGLYRAHWSEDILAEVERTLLDERFNITATDARRMLDLIRLHFEEAEVQGYQHLVPSMTNHPGDRHVLAAAVVAGAQVIVTANRNDFPESALGPYGIEAQTPNEFLEHLFFLEPDTMVATVQARAASLDEDLTVTLSYLRPHAPRFAELVEQYTHDPALIDWSAH